MEIFCGECVYCKIIAVRCPLDFEDASPECRCMNQNIKGATKSNWYAKDVIQILNTKDCSKINKDNDCNYFSKK